MKLSTKQYFVLASILFIASLSLLFLVVSKAEASEILYSQITASSTISTNASFWGGVVDYDAYTDSRDWVVDKVDYWINGYTVSGGADTWTVVARLTGVVVATSSNSYEGFTAGQFYDFNFSPLDFINLGYGVGDDMDFRLVRTITAGGADTLNMTSSGVHLYPPFIRYSSGNISKDPVMAIWGIHSGDTPEGGVVTRIISQDEPDNGELAPDDIVTFQFDYYNNDTDDVPVTIAGVDIRDLSSGFEYVPLESDINVSGVGSFSQIADLVEGHFHMWRPFLRNASSTRIVYGSWYSFDVVSYSGEFDPLDPSADSATSTALGRFFSQQGYLASKFPFAYFYDVAGIVATLDDTDVEDSFPTLTLSMASSSLAMPDLVFLSKDTVEMFAGSTMVALFRTLMGAVLWIAFAFAVYTQIKNLLRH